MNEADGSRETAAVDGPAWREAVTLFARPQPVNSCAACVGYAIILGGLWLPHQIP